MLVNDCVLRVDRMTGENVFSVFCFHRFHDDMDIIGDFETAAEAEAFCDFMRQTEGYTAFYDSERGRKAFCDFLQSSAAFCKLPID